MLNILNKSEPGNAYKYMITELINEANCLIYDNRRRNLDSNELIWLYRELLYFKDTFGKYIGEELSKDITTIRGYIYSLL